MKSFVLILLIGFLSCQKEPQPNEFIGLWKSYHACIFTGGWKTTCSQYREFYEINGNVYVKISDAVHSSLDIVKDIPVYIGNNATSFYTSVTTTATCRNIKLEMWHNCVLNGDTLYETGTYSIHTADDNTFMAEGTFNAKYIK